MGKTNSKDVATDQTLKGFNEYGVRAKENNVVCRSGRSRCIQNGVRATGIGKIQGSRFNVQFFYV